MPANRPHNRLAVLAIFAAAVALIAGCGSSTTTTSTAQTSPTAELEKYRAEIKPKNEAVESAKHALESVRFTGSNYSELVAAFTTYIKAYQTYLTGLEQVTAPISVAKTAENYFTHLRQHLANLQEAMKAAVGHDGAAVSADLEKAHAAAKECSTASAFYAEACRW
jgi:transaldolase